MTIAWGALALGLGIGSYAGLSIYMASRVAGHFFPRKRSSGHHFVYTGISGVLLYSLAKIIDPRFAFLFHQNKAIVWTMTFVGFVTVMAVWAFRAFGRGVGGGASARHMPAIQEDARR